MLPRIEVAPPNLTRREKEVSTLVAQGLTNREIAARLFISERTVESHLEQIRGKLGFSSRVQVAAWVAAQALSDGGPRAPESAAPAPAPTAPSRRSRLPLGRPAGITAAAVVVLGVLVLTTGVVAQRWLFPSPATGVTLATVAGTGQSGYSEDGGPAGGSPLVHPVAVAVGPGGELYIADGNRIRTVGEDGRIATLAGTGVAGNGGDGGPALQAQLNFPQGLAVDSAGAVYIADTLNNRVRRVDSKGVITTVAGTGKSGFAGDGKLGPQAELNLPTGLAIGFGDTLFIADTGNNVVRQLGHDGVIRTFAGTGGEAGYKGDAGSAGSADLHAPAGLALDEEGNLYIADTLNERVRRVDVNGQIATVAGTGAVGYAGDGRPAVFGQLNLATNPLAGIGQGLAVDSRGEVFIADALNHRVRRLDLQGVLSTVAQFTTPLGVAVDRAGVLYVADGDDLRVRRIEIR
jgi:DNA-binding CsgD family transcriptional regulator/sugar lactone lactonase YvrE